MRDSVTVDEVIGLLNEIVRLDRLAVQKLVEARVQCNRELADHPSVQTLADPTEPHESHKYSVGVLGVLNGLFGVDERGYGPISAKFEKDDSGKMGDLIDFERTPQLAVRTVC